jgi:hypothetical protein
MPQRRHFDLYALLSHPLAQLRQAQIRLCLYPGPNTRLQMRDTRLSVPPNRITGTLALVTETIPDIVDKDAADFETPSNVAGAFPTFQRT